MVNKMEQKNDKKIQKIFNNNYVKLSMIIGITVLLIIFFLIFNNYNYDDVNTYIMAPTQDYNSQNYIDPTNIKI